MKGKNKPDTITRIISRILCPYEHLNLLQLWYECGEDDALKGRTTKEEISERLEYLSVKGLVEGIMGAETDDDSGGLICRLKRGADGLESQV